MKSHIQLSTEIGTTSSDIVSSISAREVDGFTISSFSGAYFGHLFTDFPFFITVITIILLTLSYFRKQFFSNILVSTLLFFIASNIIFYEATIHWYYNNRYLTYLFPPLYLLSYYSLNIVQSKALRYAIILLLLLSPFTIWNQASKIKKAALKRQKLKTTSISVKSPKVFKR